MPEQVRLTFYKVNFCGYYRRRQPRPQFGALPDTLAALLRWVDPGNKPLEHTSTYTPNNESDGALRTFCAGLQRSARGDFLLTTWNELPHNEGTVSSIDVSAAVGTVVPTQLEQDQDLVPGFPAYFWFVPEHDMVVNIRFDTERLSGTRGMNLYMQGFLNHFSPHVVIDEQTADAEHNFVGYSATGEGETVPVNPRYHCVQCHRPQHVANLRGRLPHVRKVIRKAILSPEGPGERHALAGVFQMLGLMDAPANLPAIRAKSEVDFTPSQEQFDEMVENWAARRDEDWENIGFVFHGAQKTEWLSEGAGRFTYEIDVDRGGQSFVDARELLSALTPRRDRILALIQE